jgi:hypothetical protein
MPASPAAVAFLPPTVIVLVEPVFGATRDAVALATPVDVTVSRRSEAIDDAVALVAVEVTILVELVLGAAREAVDVAAAVTMVIFRTLLTAAAVANPTGAVIPAETCGAVALAVASHAGDTAVVLRSGATELAVAVAAPAVIVTRGSDATEAAVAEAAGVRTAPVVKTTGAARLAVADAAAGKSWTP